MENKRRKITIKDIAKRKRDKEMLVCVAAYDAPLAAIADEVGFDLLINGNAGPMSLLGHQTPLSVRFEEQLILSQAVSRVVQYGLMVGHMPYMTYQYSVEDSVRNAARLCAGGGAAAVKGEGSRHTARYVSEIVRAGIPVMGHMGMQASRKLEQSGYGFKGRTAVEAAKIVDDSRAFVDAGVFAIIIEYVPVELTQYLAQTLPVPIISVSAGQSPDGIYIGTGDAIGYTAFPSPKHAKTFVDIRPTISQGLEEYKRQVLSDQYPVGSTVQHMTNEEHEAFLKLARN